MIISCDFMFNNLKYDLKEFASCYPHPSLCYVTKPGKSSNGDINFFRFENFVRTPLPISILRMPVCGFFVPSVMKAWLPRHTLTNQHSQPLTGHNLPWHQRTFPKGYLCFPAGLWDAGISGLESLGNPLESMRFRNPQD